MALTSKPLNSVRATVPTNIVTKGEMVRVNLNVSSDVRDRWKKAAIDHKMSLTDLISEAVEGYLSK